MQSKLQISVLQGVTYQIQFKTDEPTKYSFRFSVPENPRFVDMQNGTVWDNERGIRWLQFPATCLSSSMTFSEVTQRLPNITDYFDEHCTRPPEDMREGWRMPTYDELDSLREWYNDGSHVRNKNPPHSSIGEYIPGRCFYVQGQGYKTVSRDLCDYPSSSKVNYPGGAVEGLWTSTDYTSEMHRYNWDEERRLLGPSYTVYDSDWNICTDSMAVKVTPWHHSFEVDNTGLRIHVNHYSILRERSGQAGQSCESEYEHMVWPVRSY